MDAKSKAMIVIETLRAAGHQALFAGGCVRDVLLGKEPKDFDIATDATPARVQELFERTVAVGAHFGVVIVMINGLPIEVATFRSDGNYEDGRRPTHVTFSDAKGDAMRRDFTINGLFLDPVKEEVLDFVGGREDIKNKILRAIGNPDERFREDRLRVLRGVRFAAALDFEIEPATWKAIQEAAPRIGEISIERIREELVRIFVHPSRVRGLDLLESSGLLENVLPEMLALHGCEQPPEFHPEGDVYIHTRIMLGLLKDVVSPALVFAVLLHDIAKPRTFQRDETGRIRFNGHEHLGAEMTESILRRLRFSNHDIHATTEMVRHHMAFKDAPNMRLSKLRRFMARETFPEEMELHRVDCQSSHGSLDIYQFLKEKQSEFASEPVIPPRLIKGHDLIALGWKPGPAFREVLETIQTRQLEGTLTSREEALAWLAKEFPKPPR